LESDLDRTGEEDECFSSKRVTDLLNEVKDRESFLAFVNALAADHDESERLEKLYPSNPYGSGHLGWENGSIGTFLDAMARWAEDINQVTKVDFPRKVPGKDLQFSFIWARSTNDWDASLKLHTIRHWRS
jgi:hypothetical protein